MVRPLKQLWMLNNVTEEEIAVKADVSVRTVSRINNGHKVQLRSLRRVCAAVGIPIEQYHELYNPPVAQEKDS